MEDLYGKGSVQWTLPFLLLPNVKDSFLDLFTEEIVNNCKYLLKDATDVDNLNIIPIIDALDIPKIEIDNELLKKIKNGVKVDNSYHEKIVMFTNKNIPIAIYKDDNNILKSYRGFNISE